MSFQDSVGILIAGFEHHHRGWFTTISAITALSQIRDLQMHQSIATKVLQGDAFHSSSSWSLPENVKMFKGLAVPIWDATAAPT